MLLILALQKSVIKNYQIKKKDLELHINDQDSKNQKLGLLKLTHIVFYRVQNSNLG